MAVLAKVSSRFCQTFTADADRRAENTPKSLFLLFYVCLQEFALWVRLRLIKRVLCQPCGVILLDFLDTLHHPPKTPGKRPLQAPQLAACCYPRVCGGTMVIGPDGSPYWGLSPRVRGNRASGEGVCEQHGSIPACAGEPHGRFGRVRSLAPDMTGLASASG